MKQLSFWTKNKTGNILLLIVSGIFTDILLLGNTEVPHQLSKEYEAHLIVFKQKSDVVYSSTIEEEVNINKKPRTQKKDFKRKLKAEIKKMRVEEEKRGLKGLLIVLLILFAIISILGLVILFGASGFIDLSAIGVAMFIIGSLATIAFGMGIGEINKRRKRVEKK